MAKIRTLSKTSILELQRMRTRLLALEQSVQVGSRGHNDPTAHYIVSTPSGGIPAAVDGAELVPGEAVCKMFRRLTEDSIMQLKDLNRNQIVRNFETSAIPGNTIILAHRDAWGDMWAIVGGGGGGDTALSITCRATADFDSADATIPIRVMKVRNGTGVAVDDVFSIPNKLWKFGTPDEYAYGGVTGTIIEAQRDTDNVWTILELTCTIPCADGGGASAFSLMVGLGA